MLELGEQEAGEHQSLAMKAEAHTALTAFFGPRSVGGPRAFSKDASRAAHFLEVEPLLVWLKNQLRPGDVVLVKGSGWHSPSAKRKVSHKLKV